MAYKIYSICILNHKDPATEGRQISENSMTKRHKRSKYILHNYNTPVIEKK
jgi:hypothetical protein